MNANGPFVNVVIPAHNAQDHLAACLASAAAQAADVSLEIMVVDDGSRDETAAIAGRLANVRCLSQPNRGPSAARNAGIAAARGELIAFLDADDLWPAGKLAAQMSVLAAHPDAALVFGDCLQFDERGPWPRTEFSAGGFGTAAWGTSGLVPDASERLLEENFITTGSVIVRRSALTELGGFAEDLRLVEDLDLWLRIARRHVIAWCGELCLLRRRHDVNTSRDPQAMSLAWLEVLHRQAASEPAPTVRRLVAQAHLRLAELALARGDWRTGAACAWRSLAAPPRLHKLWHLGRAALSSIAGSGDTEAAAHKEAR